MTPDKDIMVSPRQTDGRLDIYTDMHTYHVSVFSLAGHEVKRFSRLSGPQSLSIDALRTGIYFVKVQHESTETTFKVVKY